MPFTTIDHSRLFYRLEGNEQRPVLVLSHSIGVDHSLWDRQAIELLPYFRILRYDTRGHGASDGPAGEYSMEQLARDVLCLTDALGIDKFAFCGLSLGGMIGQWLGVHAADRVTHLILANTSPNAGPPSNWDTRRRVVLDQGMAAVVDLFLQRSFTAETSARREPRIDSVRRTFLGTHPAGYAACCSAIRDMDHTPLLRGIRVPTLVIAGDRDVATPWEGHGDVLAREIPGARVAHLAAAHLSNIERPRSFTAALLSFLMDAPERNSLQAGDEMRRKMLGDEYVDAAHARTTDFTKEFQDLITRYAWGTVWARPGLDPATRRLLVLSTTAALGRWEEYRAHVRAGLAHELEPCDLKEALLQLAIYAGVPASNTAFAIAAELLSGD